MKSVISSHNYCSDVPERYLIDNVERLLPSPRGLELINNFLQATMKFDD